MLTLRTSKANLVLDLTDSGVKVTVPPLDVAGMRAAEYRAAKAHAAARVEMGIGDDQTADDEQTGYLEGVYAQARIRFLADKIVAWEGIIGEDGLPLPLTSEALDAFASHPVAGPAFARAYQQPVQAVVAEGNGSAPSSAGGTGEGSDTAPGAQANAPPAPAPSTPPTAKPARPVKPR